MTTDRRGFRRPAGPGCDSGGYEFGALPPLPFLGCPERRIPFPHFPNYP